MAILLENIVDKKVVARIDGDIVTSINEAINNELNKQKKEIEKTTAQKFDKIVESISAKFSAQVDKAIVESVSGSVSSDVNKKLLEAMSGIVNLLEDVGVYSTEKTKQLTNQLREANKNLEVAYKEREIVRDQLNEEKKTNYILQRLTGSNPKIVNAALEYFKDKDIIDVQDEIDAFIDGDFSNLLHDDTDKMDDGLSEITLDQVDDALKGIASDNNERASKAKFESLGRGLSPQRGVGLNRTSSVDLNAVTESVDSRGYDEDAGIALDQIENFKDLGYRFR